MYGPNQQVVHWLIVDHVEDVHLLAGLGCFSFDTMGRYSGGWRRLHGDNLHISFARDVHVVDSPLSWLNDSLCRIRNGLYLHLGNHILPACRVLAWKSFFGWPHFGCIRKLEGPQNPKLLDGPTALGYVDSTFARYDY